MPEPLRILIGTDDREEVARLRAALEALGYIVAGDAPSGEAAIGSGEGLGPQVILLDLRMPDGLDAVGKLMARRPTPILALGRDDPAVIAQALVAGVMDYLVQPVQPQKLAPAIALAWARFHELLALRKEVENMQTALLLERQVVRAKGILRQRLRLSEGEAHRKLLRLAQNQRYTLAKAAARIISADQFFASLGQL